MEVRDERRWRAQAEAHHARVDRLVAAHLTRRRNGVKHPVHDFLFGYYSFRPAQLRSWHPGYGVALAGAEPGSFGKGYSGVDPVHVTDEYAVSQRPLVTATRRLLAATLARPAQFGCFGLHEWAMVYRAEETRHDWPLRLGSAGTDEVVESHRIGCTHFDAFRFFTEPAVPLNAHAPRSDNRAELEQPGCLHGNMDLYKHAFRLAPLVPSDLVADCFELARDIRVLDMRAAPYDLSGLGYDPVRIETSQGKQQYIAAQQGFATRAAPLRERLRQWCEHLLTAVNGPRPAAREDRR